MMEASGSVSYLWQRIRMRIREAPPPKKKHTDPTEQDADPQPCFSYIKINNFPYLFYITFSAYPLLATSEVLRMIEPPRMVRGAELGAGQTVGQLPANST